MADSSYQMTSLDLSRANGVAAKQGRHDRLYQIDAKYVLDTDQAQPLRVLYGRDFVTSLQMMPCYDLKSHGGGSDKDGYDQPRYTAGIVLALCCGTVDRILRIDNSNDTVWEGNFLLGPDGSGWNGGYEYNTLTTDSGSLRVYAGTATQSIDPALMQMEAVDDNGNAVSMENGAYRGVCYLVGENFSLGNQNAMNNLRVEAVRIPKTLEENAPVGYEFPWVGDETITEFPHSTADGDMYVPEIVFDLLTNASYGVGLDPSQIDYDSFCRAQYNCVKDGIAVSGCIDEQSTFLDLISQLLEYIDGFLTWENGKISLKLIRWDDHLRQRENVVMPDTGPGISMPVPYPDFMTWNLTEEPSVAIDTDDRWQVSSVTYTDRSRSYESTSYSFECPMAKALQVPENTNKTIDRPWVKSRSVAAKLARRLGFAGVFPSVEITCKTIQPIDSAHVGDICNIGYDAIPMLAMGDEEATNWCNRQHPLLRIMQIIYPQTDSNEITYICRLHRGINPDLDYGEASDESSFGGTIRPQLDKEGGWLAPHVLIENEKVLDVFIGRPSESALEGYRIEATDKNQAYVKAGASKEFQVPGTLLSWTTTATGIKLKILIKKRDGETYTGYVDAIAELLNYQYFYVFTAAQIESGAGYAQTGKRMCLKKVDFNDSGIDYSGYSQDDYYIVEVTALAGELGTLSPGDNAGVSYMPSQTVFLTLPSKYFTIKNSNGIGNHFGVKAAANFGKKYGDEPSSQVIPTTATISNGLTIFEPTVRNWGLPVLPDAGSAQVTAAAGEPVEAGDDGDIYTNTQSGTVYLASDNDWDEIGLVEVSENSQVNQLLDYFYQFNASATFEHQTDCNGIIVVNIPNENPITLTLPDAETAAPGDTITIICTKSAGVVQNTITLTPTGSITDPLTNENPLRAAVGIVVKLTCDNDHSWILTRNSLLKS